MDIPETIIRKVRLMINEPTTDTWTDPEIADLFPDYVCADKFGNEPDDPKWETTYNLYALASYIWQVKAARVADEFDFTADGGSFNRSQKQLMALKQASFYDSRSKAFSLHLKQYPLTSAGKFGWQDLPYKDEIDKYEENLT